MTFYQAYRYDFNNPRGVVIIHKSLRDDIAVGDQIILVSIEGNRRRVDYDGFGTLVTVTAIEEATDKEYLRVRTDLGG